MWQFLRNAFGGIGGMDPNEGKDVTDVIHDLDIHLSEAQSYFKILKKNHESMRQGSAEIRQLRKQDEEAQNRIDIDESKEFMMNEEHEQRKLSDIHLHMNDDMKAVTKLEESLQDCLDSVKNYKRNRFDTTNRVAIQLYCAQKTELTNYAVTELKKMLTNQLSKRGIKLISELCTTPNSIKSSKPLIVICLSATRLDEDFRNAVTGAPIGSNTAVLIFHHMRKHALPTVSSKTQLMEDQAKNVGLITDVAFLDGMGLYDCDMNTNAYKLLLDFINNQCKQ